MNGFPQYCTGIPGCLESLPKFQTCTKSRLTYNRKLSSTSWLHRVRDIVDTGTERVEFWSQDSLPVITRS